MKKIIIVFTVIILSTISCLGIKNVTFAHQSACGVAGFNDPLVCGYGKGANEVALENRIRNILNTVYLWIGIIAVINR